MKMVSFSHRFLAVVGVLALAKAGSGQTTVQWPSGSGGNDHYYRLVVVPGQITWANANTAAQAAGGYLATITSAGENSFVYGSLASGNASAWFVDGANNSLGPALGGYQPVSSDVATGWNWVSGETWTYTNWASTEPSNGGGTEDRLQFFENGTSIGPHWNDVDSTRLLNSYIIEFNSNPIPEPATTAMWFGLGAVTSLALRRRFRRG